MDNRTKIADYIESRGSRYNEFADEIWGYAETAFREHKSMEAQIRLLEEEGFKVTRNVGDVETAFCGEWGSGKPVIAFLGEFDALAGLSQKAGVCQKDPEVPGANGHGCGHNLLGVASIAAAAALKKVMAEQGLKGTVRYYGCPGEEGGSGKAFMAREGVFDDVDAALTWHPANCCYTAGDSSLANSQIYYRFRGVSSHAAAAPHLGRSALDAVELMNIGVQFLREHVIQEARMHYAITDAGGVSPNVVQPYAEVLYLLRAPKSGQVKDIVERVDRIAQGAALMTDTVMEKDFVKSCANIVNNETLERDLQVSPCMVVACFAFLHHIPTAELRERFMRELVKLAMPGGLVVVSLWSFADEPEIAAKAVETTAQAVEALALEGLEAGDYLLGWQNNPNVWRYCHSFDAEEVDEVAECVEPDARLIRRFRADGRNGKMNTYLVFQKA